MEPIYAQLLTKQFVEEKKKCFPTKNSGWWIQYGHCLPAVGTWYVNINIILKHRAKILKRFIYTRIWIYTIYTYIYVDIDAHIHIYLEEQKIYRKRQYNLILLVKKWGGLSPHSYPKLWGFSYLRSSRSWPEQQTPGEAVCVWGDPRKRGVTGRNRDDEKWAGGVGNQGRDINEETPLPSSVGDLRSILGTLQRTM